MRPLQKTTKQGVPGLPEQSPSLPPGPVRAWGRTVLRWWNDLPEERRAAYVRQWQEEDENAARKSITQGGSTDS